MARPIGAACTIGLMSGTSLDGVDACAVRFNPQPELIADSHLPMPAELGAGLRWLATGEGPAPDDPIELLGRCRRDLADLYADAIALLPAAVRAEAVCVGAHGQTIRHRPEQGFSLQILDGARLAQHAGLPVVCDLRSADIALGGQGAPLVPAFHLAAFGTLPGRSAVVNIGGIANVSIIDAEAETVLAGFDTGPGNRLLDDWIEQTLGRPYDRDGQWSRGGCADPGLLASLLADPYFALPAPKSTGREQFHRAWLTAAIAAQERPITAVDVQATLVELTAGSIAAAIGEFAVNRVIVCGGGALNRALMDALAAGVAPLPCMRSDQAGGIAPLAVEAMAFAWLAWRRWHGLTGTLAHATGASRAAILGALHLPAPH
ncbi:MAG: anhydro-N-acetylmuramic acid kinase [Burkholderiaceae bacterium]